MHPIERQPTLFLMLLVWDAILDANCARYYADLVWKLVTREGGTLGRGPERKTYYTTLYDLVDTTLYDYTTSNFDAYR